jgi:hypothetical protein
VSIKQLRDQGQARSSHAVRVQSRDVSFGFSETMSCGEGSHGLPEESRRQEVVVIAITPTCAGPRP